MSIPNLLALLLLSGTVVRLTKEFFASEADCPQQKEAAALSAKTMCNSLFCYSGRCTGTRATQCTQQSPSLRVKQNTLRNKISPGTRFSCRARSIRTCEKAVARQLSKNIVQNPELFRAKTALKRFRVFDFSQFPRAGCYRIFQSPYSARVRLFSTRTVHVTIYIRNKK